MSGRFSLCHRANRFRNHHRVHNYLNVRSFKPERDERPFHLCSQSPKPDALPEQTGDCDYQIDIGGTDKRRDKRRHKKEDRCEYTTIRCEQISCG